MRYLLIIFILFPVGLLLAQNDTTYIIPSFPENLPFSIKKENTNINLPDSLGNGEYKGSIRLILFIDSTGVINSFNILQLNLKTTNFKDSVIYYKYYATPKYSEIYPKNILPYYFFLLDWMKNIPIYKTGQVNSSELYRLYIKFEVL